MTFTSFVAAAQSSPDKRLPLFTSILAARRLRSPKASAPTALLDALAKQRRLRNPRFNRLSTTLAPMKPLAPVTRIRSSVPIMDCPGPVETSFLSELARSDSPLPAASVRTMGMFINTWTVESKTGT